MSRSEGHGGRFVGTNRDAHQKAIGAGEYYTPRLLVFLKRTGIFSHGKDQQPTRPAEGHAEQSDS